MNRPSRRKANAQRQRYDDMEEESAAKATRNYSPSSSHYMTAGMPGVGAVNRIREPHPHDILCGRGGSINNHIGNKVFRDWIHERKNAYNLAPNKAEKARVSREVLNLVQRQNPPGRFLTRDPKSPPMGPTLWVEVDEVKALAKTSQALREGAPAIRARHKDTLEEKKQRSGAGRRGSKKRTYAASTPEPEPAPEPVETRPPVWPEPGPAQVPVPQDREQMPPPPVVAMSNEMAIEALRTAAEAAKHGLGVPVHEEEHQPIKKRRTQEPVEEPSPETVTPPLMPVSGEDPSLSISLSAIQKVDNLKRAHSLALSDINDGDLDFVNPFEEEKESNHSLGHMSFISLPKLSNSDLSRSRSNGKENGSPFHKTVSNRSMISELSDLECPTTPTTRSSDFDEGLKAVYSAVHNDITSTGNEDISPTHLYPFKGGSSRKRRKKRELSTDVKNWRQQ